MTRLVIILILSSQLVLAQQPEEAPEQQAKPTCPEVLEQCFSTLQSCGDAVDALEKKSTLQEQFTSSQELEVKSLREQLVNAQTVSFFKRPAVLLPLGFVGGLLFSSLLSRIHP